MLLAPTLLLNAGSGAAIARPTFSRDFAGEKTLNNGTGPAITFTRASNATYFDANGTLQTAANDTPRFDHSGGSSLGLLIEEARTNSIRNAQAGGAAVGTPGTGSSNWNISGSVNGLTRTLASGSVNGFSYIDVSFAGTATSAFTLFFDPEQQTQIVASSTQVWTHSVYLALAAGSVPDCLVGVREGLADGTLTAAATTNHGSSLTATLQRFSHTRTLTEATTARVTPIIRMTVANGATISFTLRIAAPQLEQGAFPTSYIPTTTAAATRAADSAVVTPISSFYNQSEGTFVTDTNKSPLSGSFPTIWHLTNGTNDTGNVIGFYNPSNSTISYDASPAFSFAESVSAGIAKSGFAFSASSSRMAVNGVLEPASDQAATITTDKASLRLGAKRNGSEPLNGHIRKIAYWPRRLSNSLLQQLTT